MREFHIFTLLLMAVALFGLVKRQHLHQVFETIRTYAQFDFYLRQHSETLFRYDPASQKDILANSSSKPVPRIIHRIFLQEDRKRAFGGGSHHGMGEIEHAETSSCRALHPDWLYWTWTDLTASRFMQKHYPEIWPHYLNYRQAIQRANMLRYALLHFYGGIYLDWDIDCLQPLDELRSLPWLTPGAHPVGVNNAFILSKPRHPFLAHLLAGAKKSDLSWGLPYVKNMLSTGCMFFSNMWMSYMRRHPEDPLFVLADECGRVEPHMLRGAVTTPLFEHGGASSWHDWDAGVILFIGKYYSPYVIVFALFGLVAPCVIGRRRLHRRITGRSGKLCASPRLIDLDEERMLMES